MENANQFKEVKEKYDNGKGDVQLMLLRNDFFKLSNIFLFFLLKFLNTVVPFANSLEDPLIIPCSV
ncbi:hypothetical protein Lalb_Chr10g0104421 [Lupinus albus]|uniref:Uncharacterized protein n=1 Tax=Lupinus albus TaxID=3870 RepID=A0A6A4PX21_LUPAL|nr:hypothetical protein Lalb_Chr10g0104421 [Lupinus albus]